LLCEPLETTANGKRLVVEDSAACQKTIQSPVAQQVLKTDGAGNLTWTNGASGTVLRKDATGLVEFATLNSVLQSGPVDLGSQPLTTTGAVNSGAITATSVTTTGAVNAASVTTTGAVNTNGLISSDKAIISGTSVFGIINVIANTANNESSIGFSDVLDTNPDKWVIGKNIQNNGTDRFSFYKNGELIVIDVNGNFGINTTSPARKLHVVGTVRLQGLPVYANNAAAITGGLVADDVYKTATGELRIVV
jgi:hypothetical protein